MNYTEEKRQILEVLSEKKDILLSILDIAKEQSKLIENDDTQILLEKIEFRSKLIEKLIALEQSLVENGLKENSAYSSDEAIAILSELKYIHKKIASLDENNCHHAENKVEEYKQQIREIKGDKNRITSYKNISSNTDGVYFDKKK